MRYFPKLFPMNIPVRGAGGAFASTVTPCCLFTPASFPLTRLAPLNRLILPNQLNTLNSLVLPNTLIQLAAPTALAAPNFFAEKA